MKAPKLRVYLILKKEFHFLNSGCCVLVFQIIKAVRKQHLNSIRKLSGVSYLVNLHYLPSNNHTLGQSLKSSVRHCMHFETSLLFRQNKKDKWNYQINTSQLFKNIWVTQGPDLNLNTVISTPLKFIFSCSLVTSQLHT